MGDRRKRSMTHVLCEDVFVGGGLAGSENGLQDRRHALNEDSWQLDVSF